MKQCSSRAGIVVLTLASTIAALASGRVGAQHPPSAENRLPNPSFEIVSQGVPEGWQGRSWGETEDYARWTVEPLGRPGRCASIPSVANKGAHAACTAKIAVRPNTFYRLSGWIKTKDVRGATGALLNIQNMQRVRTPAVRGTSDWRRVSTVFRTGEDPPQLEINCLFGGWGASTGQAFYDDVAVEPISVVESNTATVTIDTQSQAVPYSPMIFGGFIEHFHHQVYGGLFEPGSPLADDAGFRSDVIQAMRELRLSVVRWPGGCFVSGYHWKDGVGKVRRPTDDMAWGVQDPNTFGTDEFVAWCRRVGCEPYICTNAGNGTPQEMSDWVEYCNRAQGRHAELRVANGHAEPLGVSIWSIGNENWGGHEIGAKSVEQWGPLVLKSARMMRAVDPEIKLTAAALPNRQWTLPLLRTAGEYLDYVSVHHYWLPLWQKNETPDYLTCIMQSDGPEKLILDTIGILEDAGCRGRIKIALDEWNLRGWHHPGFPRKAVSDYDDPEVIRLVQARNENAIASQYTMADALFSASFFNACLRHAADVGMANIAPIVNTRGPLYVHPKGIVKRTTFHTIAMYANLLGSRVGKVDVEAGMLVHGDRFIAVVDAVATVDQTGRLWSIALVNRHPSKDTECRLRMNGVLHSGTFDATVLTADSPRAYNDIEHPDRVVPERRRLTFHQGVAKLPPHSLTIVRVPAEVTGRRGREQ